jgi:hypothetical protein
MGPAKSESAPESVGDESVGATFSVGAGPAVVGVVSPACAVAGGGPESRDKFGEKSAGVELAACRSTSGKLRGKSRATAPACGGESPMPCGPDRFPEEGSCRWAQDVAHGSCWPAPTDCAQVTCSGDVVVS